MEDGRARKVNFDPRSIWWVGFLVSAQPLLTGRIICALADPDALLRLLSLGACVDD